MRRNVISFSILAALLLLSATSCKKELFDKNEYNDLVDRMFRVDGIDENHDWLLTKDDTITVSTPDSHIYSIQLLTGNPRTATRVEIIAEGVCYGNQATLAYTVPAVSSLIYIAALDKDGNYLAYKSVAYGTKEIELTVDTMNPFGGGFKKPDYQTFTYLYTADFPVPSDNSFDYNDMVLRISKKNHDLSNSLSIDLTVTLAAAGTKEPYAAAIQLVGIDYDDISSVTIVEGELMDKGYPFSRQILNTESPLVRGRNGQAVINLFENVHWTYSKEKDAVGSVLCRYFNVMKTTTEYESVNGDPLTVTYRINFKSRDKARLMTFDRIDPFMIHQYNASNYEIHTYPYKFDEVLVHYISNRDAFDNHISWAVVVPKGDFLYPIEGATLCSFNKTIGETFGPYEGFAGWLRSHTSNLNWYLTVTRPQLVFTLE
jgi:LruC domain-containing protein